MPGLSARSLSFLLLCGLTLPFSLLAAQEQEGLDSPLRKNQDKADVFSFTLENDSLINGSDQNYTNGIRLAWLTAERPMPEWVDWLSKNALPIKDRGHKRLSFAVGQNIFTPKNLDTPAPILNDRPYAGWLYGSAGLVSDTGRILDTATLTLGMVGPSAEGEWVQSQVHRLIGSHKPQGWDNQLKDEPGIMLTFERQWRSMYQFSPFGMAVDATPHVATNLGNIYTDASTGLMFRFGKDLPADYGPPRIYPTSLGSDFFIPSQDFGWYLFAGFDGHAVAHNIFLDGNTFRDSQSVDRKPFVGGLQGGIAFTYDDVRISYTHVLYTREFEQQKDPAQFGSINLSMRF